MQLANGTYNHLRLEHLSVSIILQRLLHNKYINKHMYGDRSFLSKTNGINLVYTILKTTMTAILACQECFMGPIQFKPEQHKTPNYMIAEGLYPYFLSTKIYAILQMHAWLKTLTAKTYLYAVVTTILITATIPW